MKNKITFIISLSIILLINSSSYAQEVNGKDDKKNKPSMADIWRQAMPQSEAAPEISHSVTDNESEDSEESIIEIERVISDLDRKLLKAFKQGDTASLTYLLADDFISAGEGITESQANKTGFIERIANNKAFKSYDLEKINVRVYGMTAVSTVHYRKNPASSGGDSLVTTNVWVKRGNLWQVVSHHTSSPAKS